MLRERYIMTDASNRRESREYTQKILRLAKDTGMTIVKNQLDIIFNGIDLELRRDIKYSNKNMTINSYLTAMDDYKHTWWTYISRHRSSLAQGGLRQQTRPAYN